VSGPEVSSIFVQDGHASLAMQVLWSLPERHFVVLHTVLVEFANHALQEDRRQPVITSAAQAVQAIKPEYRDVVILLALALEHQSEGHLCLPLSAVASAWQEDLQTRAGRGEDVSWGKVCTHAQVLELSHFAEQMFAKPSPFVFESHTHDTFLYTLRQYRQQERLQQLLSARLGSTVVQAALPADAVLVPIPDNADDRLKLAVQSQALAVQSSLGKALFVLSGGPGTGKTTTVFHLIRAWYRLAQTRRIGLAAPTGRAARRLKESLDGSAESFGKHGQLDAVDTACLDLMAGLEPKTVHRWVGRGRNSGLAIQNLELLIIDESSMLDTRLFSLVLEALPAGACLVLVGDWNQLPSVEDGAILSDLHRLSRHRLQHDWVVELSVSMRAGSAVLELPRLIIQQPSPPATELLALLARSQPPLSEALKREGGHWYPMSRRDEARTTVVNHMVKLFSGEQDLSPLSACAMLVPTREGFWGAATLNALCIQQFKSTSTHRQYAQTVRGHTVLSGMPVMILENDESLGIFNGDRGIISHRADGQLEFSMLAAGQVLRIPLELLPAFEPSFAMTIHKSQGSEFSTVCVCLDDDTAMCSRELLYTALTRAKTTWLLMASGQAFVRACSTTTIRHSGLVEALENY